MNEKNTAEDNNFWKTIKLLLSGKIESSNNVFLVVGDEIISEDNINTTVLNDFVLNANTNLKIPELSGTDPRTDNISQQFLKATFEYTKHPCTDAMEQITTNEKFIFIRLN